MLTEALALRLLDRLRRSPYGGAWVAGARFGVRVSSSGAADEELLFATDRVQAWRGEAVDAWLHTSAGDVEALLAGRSPEGTVGYALGDRGDVADRVKQARAVMGLGALGWCGPWPDAAAAPEVVALTRRACLDLAIGPADELRPLFSTHAPAPLRGHALRLTDGARRRWCTVGLSDTAGLPELWTDGDPRVVRIAALHLCESGSLPSRLDTPVGTVRFEAGPLPLPHALTTLVKVVPGPA